MLSLHDLAGIALGGQQPARAGLRPGALVDVAALGVVLELVAALGVVFAWGVAAVAWPMLSGQELGG